MTLAPGSRLGPYEITEQIGEGGMGVVFKAKDFHLGREVALKILPEAFTADPERAARFEREAKLLAQLNHPNIAQIHGLEVQGETRALVMELVEGPTLADRLESGSLPLDESLSIARQIAEALEEAHEKGIIHRDLKPQNVKASIEGKVKVLDFGLAKAMDPAGASGIAPVSGSQLAASPTLTLGATVQGVILGSAAYMAPEQAKGMAVDKRADIWAFGVVLYEMLTGRRLFEGDSVPETLAGVLKNEIDLAALPPETPPAIRRLLRRCLERRPQDRLRDIGDARIVLADLAAGREGESVAAPGGAPVSAARLTWLPWSIAAVAVAIAAALALVGRGGPAPEPAVAARFHVPWPGEERRADDFLRDYLELSPDGRSLVMNSQDRLWVRDLDALVARPIERTEGASYPFWSPDREWVGFFADGELRKIPRNGGLPQKLCDAPSGRGAAWGPDGTIVFSKEFGQQGLWRVGDRGGEPVALPRAEAAGVNTESRYPQFLPGGRRFVFTVLSPSSEVEGIYVGDLDGSTPVRVLDGPDHAQYAPPVTPGEPGHLLFRRGQVLMARPFDAETLRFIGESFAVAEGVGVSGNTAHGSFSVAANGVLAHAASSESDMDLVLHDRSGQSLGTVAVDVGSVRGLSLSPDGRSIAWAGGERSSSLDVWIAGLVGGSPSRFTFGPAPGWSYPLWSPDGSELVYATYDLSGLPRYEIRRQRVDRTGGEQTLLTTETLNWPWDWSPDGTVVVFSRDGDDLMLLRTDGSGDLVPILDTPGVQEAHAQFSPDGRWLAYMSNELGPPEVFVQPFPPTGAKWQVSTGGGAMPRWRDDGRELYYRTGDGTLVALAVRTAGSTFEVSGEPQPLFAGIAGSGNVYQFSYDVSPDGQRFVLAQRAAGEESPITVVVGWQQALRR